MSKAPPQPSTPRPKDPPYDPIASIENEISVQTGWLLHYQSREDDQLCDRIERDLRSLKDRINRRLTSRGLAPRYGPGSNAPETWTGQL